MNHKDKDGKIKDENRNGFFLILRKSYPFQFHCCLPLPPRVHFPRRISVLWIRPINCSHTKHFAFLIRHPNVRVYFWKIKLLYSGPEYKPGINRKPQKILSIPACVFPIEMLNGLNHLKHMNFPNDISLPYARMP